MPGFFVRAYYLWPNNVSRQKNYVLCWDKECKTLYRSFIRAPMGMTLIEPLHLYHLGSGRRSRSDGRKLQIPSTSRTLAVRVENHQQTIMHADGDWQAVEGVLSKDMAALVEYLQTWKLKLSTTKTVSAAFRLNNKEAKRELKVKYNNKTLPFYFEPKYLGVTLDRSFTYR